MLVLTDKFEFPNKIERNGTNQPELRHDAVYTKIKDKRKVIIPASTLTYETLVNLGIHDQDYLEFLKGAYRSFLEEKDFEYERSDGFVPYHFSKRKSNQSHKQLVLWRQIGYYCDDNVTPIGETTYQLSMQSANNCYAAAKMIDEYDIIYCLNTYPGHHAQRDSCSGYCYINNGYVCVTELLKSGRRVAVLDVDYHAGSHEILHNNPKVLSISIHADPRYEYPSFSGYPSENTKYNYNIVFPKKADWAAYSKCLEQALDIIKEYGPDVLVVPFGGDTFDTDPDASDLYGCGLELEDYSKMGRMISEVCKKIIVTQEGGYDMDNIDVIVDNFLDGLDRVETMRDSA